MSGPMYGGQKVSREPLRPVEQRARLLPGRQVEKVGYQLQRGGRMWQKMLEDHEKEKQLLQANALMGTMMKEWHSEYAPKFKSQEGNAAIGITVAATEALDTVRKKYGQELSPFATTHLTQQWQRFSDAQLSGVADWEGRQQAVASQQEIVNVGNGWLETISNDPTIDTVQKALDGYASVRTADLVEGDDIANFPRMVADMRQFKESAHAMQIIALTRNGDTAKAEKLLDKYGTAPETGDPKQNAIIGAKNRNTLKGLIDKKNEELRKDRFLVDAQAHASEIWAMEGTIEEKLEAAEKVKSGDDVETAKMRDEVTRRVKAKYDTQKTLEAQADIERTQRWATAWYAEPDMATIPHWLTPGEQRAARAYATRHANGKVVQTQPGAIQEIENLISTPGEGFKNAVLETKFGNRISEAALKPYIQLQTKVRMGGGQKEVARLTAVNTQVDNHMLQIGIKPSGGDMANAKEVERFRTYVWQEMQAAGLTKTTATEEDMLRILQRATKIKADTDHWYRTRKYGYQAERTVAPDEVIPTQGTALTPEHEMVRASLRIHLGREPTSGEITAEHAKVLAMEAETP